MNSNIKYQVFEGEGFPLVESLLENITHEQRQLLKEMMLSGHFIKDGLDVSRFLKEDLSINLEKLELATTLTVIAMEANSPEDDVTLNLYNLETYYETRGISGKEKKEREERTFLLGFISSVAAEASKRDTLVVKFV
jgi:hypothetical protein